MVTAIRRMSSVSLHSLLCCKSTGQGHSYHSSGARDASHSLHRALLLWPADALCGTVFALGEDELDGLVLVLPLKVVLNLGLRCAVPLPGVTLARVEDIEATDE